MPKSCGHSGFHRYGLVKGLQTIGLRLVPGIGRFPHYVPYILKFHAVVAFLHGAERQLNHRLLLLNNAATIIRPATPADAAAIRELALQIWPDTYLPIIGPEQLAYMLNLFYTEEVLMAQMQGADQRYFLLCEGDEPMGFASFLVGAS